MCVCLCVCLCVCVFCCCCWVFLCFFFGGGVKDVPVMEFMNLVFTRMPGGITVGDSGL